MNSRPDGRAPEYESVERTERPPLPALRARQGVTGHNARYVLGFSLAAAVIALLVLYLVFFL